MRAGLIPLAGLLACAGPALAAGPSFDCAKATTAHERLICQRPALARDDAALAQTYREAIDRLPPDGRARLTASERAWVEYSRTVCPIPYPRRRGGIWSDAAECLDAEYRERDADLRGAVRKIGPFTVVRLDAYRLVRLGPDDSGARYAGGLAVEQANAAWIDPESAGGALRSEAERLNASLLPARLRTGAPHFALSPKAESDDDGTDSSLNETISAVTPLIVTSRTVEWSIGHGTPHGWGYTQYRAVWRSDGRPLKASDLFRPGTPWASMVEARIDVEARPYEPLKWGDDERALDGVELTPDAFAVNAGYVDGYAGGEKVVAIAWADLEPFLSQDGRRIVDSLHSSRKE